MNISDVPDNMAVIEVPVEKVAKWGITIQLLPEALDLLVEIAGPTPDPRYIKDMGDVDLATENWGWFPFWSRDDGVITPGAKRSIVFWFKDVTHAVYFKTLWGGA